MGEKFLKGKPVNEATDQEAGGLALKNAMPLSGNEYRYRS